MDADRDPDPDPDPDFERGLRRSARRRRIVLIVVALAAAIGLGLLFASSHHGDDGSAIASEITLTADQRAQLDAAIAHSRHDLEGRDAAWRAAIAAVDPRTVPADAPACTALDWARRDLTGNAQGWDGWEVAQPLGFNASSIASFSHAPFPITFVAVGAALPAHSPEATAVAKTLDRLAAGGSSTRPFAERLGDATVGALHTTDVLIALDEIVEPRLEAHDRFTPGAVVARAWLFDHVHDRLACAGVIRVGNSDLVDPRSSNLDDDLVINLVRAIPGGVRAVGAAAP